MISNKDFNYQGMSCLDHIQKHVPIDVHMYMQKVKVHLSEILKQIHVYTLEWKGRTRSIRKYTFKLFTYSIHLYTLEINVRTRDTYSYTYIH